MTVLHLDFETFSEANLKKVGAYRYAEDPSTDVLICCWAIDDGPVQTWLPWRGGTAPAALVAHVRARRKIVAHNAQFERAIWQAVLVRRYGMPATLPEQFICTAAIAAQCALPRSLDGATTAMSLPHKKNESGAKLIKMFCMPRKATKADPRTRVMPMDAKDEFKVFMRYCLEDIEAERGLYHELPALPPYEQSLFTLDMVINERGLPVDMELVRRTMPIVAELAGASRERTMQLTDGIAPTQVAQLREWLAYNECDLPNLQAKTIEAKLLDDTLPDVTRELLQLRLESGLASVKKLDSMLRVCSPVDGRARGTILFNGAHTGRWSGRLIQPHNFKRGKLTPFQQGLVFDALMYGDADLMVRLWNAPLDAISQCMRGFIAATLGKLLLVVDYSAIEARVLAWLADELALLEAFRNGIDVYKLMAVHVFGIPIEQVTSEQRRICKQIVLGCGYGLGAVTFVGYCLNAGVNITDEFAQDAVRVYRETNKNIVRYWRKVETAAITAVQTGRTTRAGRVLFEVVGVFLTVVLPSGRRLYYPYPKVEATIRWGKPGLQLTFREEYHGNMMRVSTYGGRLVENIVQAVARDFMANGMTHAEDADFPLVGTVHDEIISETDEDRGGDVEEFEHVVCTLPEWGEGCPIGAEGFATQRYRKG